MAYYLCQQSSQTIRFLNYETTAVFGTLEGKFVLPGLSGLQAKFQGCTVWKQVASHLSGPQFDLKLDWKRQNLLLGADRNTP